MDPRPTSDEPESLAAHAGFLRALARGLLFDRAAADDVAQKALLAALQRERRGGATASSSGGFSLKAWLAGVVRNLARERGREEQRRVAREQAAARPEALPSAVDTVARLELMQRLIGVVRGLEEPYRTTVLLRFFDGLKPAAIARRMEVPVETVRTRLKRALERLRGELDARHGGDRAAWGLALLPTALPASGGVIGGVVASATFHALVLGGLEAVAVSTKLKVLTGVAAATITAAVVWSAIDDEPAPERVVAHAAAPETAAPIAAPKPDSPAAAEAADATPDAPSRAEVERNPLGEFVDPSFTFVIRGRAHLTNGAPRGGMKLDLSRYDGYETVGEPAAVVKVEADANGRFLWAQRPPGGTVTIVATSRDPDCAPLREKRLVLSGDAPGELDLTVYPYDCVVFGKVTDERDEPIPDAQVQSWRTSGPSECDEAGEYTVRAASSYGDMTLSAWSAGRVEGRATVTLPGPGSRVESNFRLRPGGSMRGHVRDEHGQPIAGATVRASSAWYALATTGSDGRYSLDAIDPVQREDSVTVRCAGYVTININVTTAGEADHDFVLLRGARVDGRVVDAAGQPVRGAEVWIGQGRYYADMETGLSHDDGSFSFEHVAPGARQIGCEKKGLPLVETALQVPTDRDRLTGVLLQFGASHFLAGKVVDGEGKPVSGANVLYCRDHSGFDGYAKTNDAGAFRLDAMGAGPYFIRISRGGFLMTDQPSGPLDREDVIFKLERGGGLAGRVVDAESGEPVTAFRVRFVEARCNEGEQPGWGWEASWSDPGRSFIAKDGTWRCDAESIPIGSVIGIEVTAEGYAAMVDPHVVVVGSPDPAATIFRLGHGTRVTGTLRDEAGHPVADAMVRLEPDSLHRSRWSVRNDDARWCVSSDGNGAFEIEQAPAGECRLNVQGQGFAPHVDGPFTVPAVGGVPPRTITLTKGGRIDGVLLDAGGSPQAGRDVYLFILAEAGSGAQPLQATTDAEGRFQFDSLPHGVQQVSVQRLQGRQSVNELTAAVRIDGPDPIALKLQPRGDASLHGRLTGDLPANVERVVNLHWLGPPDSTNQVAPPETGQRSDRGVFGEGDRFEVEALDPGRYHVYASCWDPETGAYYTGTTEVTVRAGATAETTLRLERSK